MKRTEKKIAAIADIHGNSFALRAVLRDIERRGVDTILNLGDSIYGPLDPAGTYKLLVEANAQSIGGNECSLILNYPKSGLRNETIEYVHSQINSEIISWLEGLPFDLVNENEVYCCHGTPKSDTEYLLEYLEGGHIRIKDIAVLDQMLKEVKQNVILCGHTHVPNIVKTARKLIINAGSVGLPAYADELPVFHKMKTYSPFASYSILSINNGLYSVDQIKIEYEYEEAARLAEKNNRNDWAHWIRTGIA